MAKIAIIETGGKQYLVAEGTVLKVEKIKGTHKVGDILTFDKVLLTDDGAKTEVGAPTLKGAKVTAELIEDGRNQTVTVIKYRQKSRYFKKRGHRQSYAKIKVTALP
ncbi:MAG TPA: 50S ribosomal protein L21 [Candidatus Paceibacterota bacterium]|nr:50S ribosomal protein L21 [Candidatus Paceibacterota bacterium]